MAVLTISRMFGAGGKTLGEMISKRLGYKFYDNELIQMVAKRAKVSTDWVEAMEKEAGGRFQKLMSTIVPKNLVEKILDIDHGYLDEEIYTDMLKHILIKLAETGDAVILGRGGQYILRNRPDTYHVLLVADFEHRVQFMESHYDLPRKQAKQAVELQDKRRTNLYRKLGKFDYDKTDHYHVVFNMSMLDMEKACDLICDLVGHCHT